MNAAGQISGLLHQTRPGAEILEEMVAGAADILGKRIPATVQATPGV
ncbi:MAG: hypothetical protein U5Q44_15695 [Dehalococcoidia bacterium]|nr:hypothetical protein [Dehalococcoidia bacterium]